MTEWKKAEVFLWQILPKGSKRKIRWFESRWYTDSNPITFEEFDDHIRGREVYGIYGPKCSYWIVIDLDYHRKKLMLFLRRLRVLLNAFHGDTRCHFQVSDDVAGGVHLILVFGRPCPTATRVGWLRRKLRQLEAVHHLGLDTLEIVPGTKPVRFPLATGRTLLLDCPLDKVRRGKREVPNIVRYVEWLKDPDRKYMPKSEVFRWIVERLDIGPPSEEQHSDKSRHSTNPTATVPPTKRSLRGRTRQALIKYWQEGDTEQFAHLNAALLVSLRVLLFEGLEKAAAIELLCGYAARLPAKASKRIGQPDLIRAEIARVADLVWCQNGRQAAPGESTTKLRAVINAWDKMGFRFSDCRRRFKNVAPGGRKT
jgi:hypothetical protein